MASRRNKYNIDKFKKARSEYNKKYYAKTQNAINKYNRWTREEEEEILESTLTDSELSQKLGRSTRAILEKRHKLLGGKKKTRRANLCNKTFGNIKVIKDGGGDKVLCLCLLCGGRKMMDRYNIQRPDRIKAGDGCGCKRKESGLKNAQSLATKKDLAGKTFGNIKVIEWTGEKKGTQKIYRCECLRCGKIFETRGASITRGDTKSCGCLSVEQATSNITADCIYGTKVTTLTAKMRSDNTSGAVGVSQRKHDGYWVAYIGFKGKRYTLYQGPDKEEAIKRRKEAEQKIHGDFFEWLKTAAPEQWERVKNKISADKL